MGGARENQSLGTAVISAPDSSAEPDVDTQHRLHCKVAQGRT